MQAMAVPFSSASAKVRIIYNKKVMIIAAIQTPKIFHRNLLSKFKKIHTKSAEVIEFEVPFPLEFCSLTNFEVISCISTTLLVG